jgi:hypothetical protein
MTINLKVEEYISYNYLLLDCNIDLIQFHSKKKKEKKKVIRKQWSYLDVVTKTWIPFCDFIILPEKEKKVESLTLVINLSDEITDTNIGRE